MCSRPKEVEKLEHVPRTPESMNTADPGSKVTCSFLNCSVIGERRCVSIGEVRFVVPPPVRTSHEIGEATTVPSNLKQLPLPNHISFNCSTSLFAAFSITINSKPSVITHQTGIRGFFEIHTRT
jgi:hypothetical protein